jgi:4-hydroxy-tetrahydrodipicolinate synthase
MKLAGTFTALITPFKNDQLDEEGLEFLLRKQMEEGVQGVVLMGSTGEGSTLNEEEQSRVVSIAVNIAKEKLILIAATGSYSTKMTIEKTAKAKKLGADAALVVTPYYNKPTQEGIFHHYEAITRAVDLPILLYNIPGRTGTNIESATMERIACLPHVVGVKESSGNFGLASEYLNIHPDFTVLAGDDALTLPLMALGAKGVISVASNLVPRKMTLLVDACARGDFEEAKRHHFELLPFFRAEFIETNPIPIKEALELCGYPAGGVRLPLWKLRPENRQMLAEVMEALDLSPNNLKIGSGLKRLF